MGNTVHELLFPRGASAVIKSIARSRNQTISGLIDEAVIAKLCLAPSLISPAPLAPASACVICGNPLPEGKARYCSDECKHEGHRRSAAESYRRKHQSQSSDT